MLFNIILTKLDFTVRKNVELNFINVQFRANALYLHLQNIVFMAYQDEYNPVISCKIKRSRGSIFSLQWLHNYVHIFLKGVNIFGACFRHTGEKMKRSKFRV